MKMCILEADIFFHACLVILSQSMDRDENIVRMFGYIFSESRFKSHCSGGDIYKLACVIACE